MFRIVLCALMAIGLTQYAWPQPVPPPTPVTPPPRPSYPSYPAFGWYDGAATAGESYRRGMAAIIRSAGEAALRRSEAARNYEEAREEYFENRLRGARTFYELRDMYERRQAIEHEPPSDEQLFRINQSRRPERLSPSEIDPKRGLIDWPAILEQEKFTLELAEVERLFGKRARLEGDLSADDYLELRRAVQRVRDQFEAQIESLPPEDYIRGKKFLDSLMYEIFLTENE